VKKHPLDGLQNTLSIFMDTSLKSENPRHQGMSISHTVPPEVDCAFQPSQLWPVTGPADPLTWTHIRSDFRSRGVFAGGFLSWLSAVDHLSLGFRLPGTRLGHRVLIMWIL
jgi:hypothetical protein